MVNVHLRFLEGVSGVVASTVVLQQVGSGFELDG